MPFSCYSNEYVARQQTKSELVRIVKDDGVVDPQVQFSNQRSSCGHGPKSELRLHEEDSCTRSLIDRTECLSQGSEELDKLMRQPVPPQRVAPQVSHVDKGQEPREPTLPTTEVTGTCRSLSFLYRSVSFLSFLSCWEDAGRVAGSLADEVELRYVTPPASRSLRRCRRPASMTSLLPDLSERSRRMPA